jgi:hypothetical protein
MVLRQHLGVVEAALPVSANAAVGGSTLFQIHIEFGPDM